MKYWEKHDIIISKLISLRVGNIVRVVFCVKIEKKIISIINYISQKWIFCGSRLVVDVSVYKSIIVTHASSYMK